jgi:hypothetical protein
MTQYIAPKPDILVFGGSITSALGDMIDRDMEQILVDHGISGLSDEKWFPMQAWLDVLRALGEGENAISNLVAIGMHIPEKAKFPPNITDYRSALELLDTAYHMNHKNYDNIGTYTTIVIDDQHIDIMCDNPYPCDFDYGILYGLGKRFMPKGRPFSVYHDNTKPCRKRGAESCTYHVVIK